MLKVKAFGLAVGIMWAVVAGWVTLLALISPEYIIPFTLVDHFYVGLMSLSWAGIVLNAVLFFIDGFIFGVILACLYNKFAG